MLDDDDLVYISRKEERALRQVVVHSARALALLALHGSAIVPHLMDTDDNAGQFLRDALDELKDSRFTITERGE